MLGRLPPLGITATIVVALLGLTPGRGHPADLTGVALRSVAALHGASGASPAARVAGSVTAAAAEPTPTPQVGVQGRVGRARVAGGQVQRLTAVVRSNATVDSALVDLEVYDSSNHKVFQATQIRNLPANVSIAVTRPYTLSRRAYGGTYNLVVGVFGPHWSPVYSWGTAAQFSVKGPLPTIVSATGSVSPALAHPGQTATLTARVSASNHSLSHALVDIELYKASGSRLCQRVTTGVHVPKDGSTLVTAHCAIPTAQASGDYVMRVGVFGPKWSPLYVWNNGAATFTVTAWPS